MDTIIFLNLFGALQEGIFYRSKSFLFERSHSFNCKLIAHVLTLSYQIGKPEKSSNIALDSFSFLEGVVEE